MSLFVGLSVIVYGAFCVIGLQAECPPCVQLTPDTCPNTQTYKFGVTTSLVVHTAVSTYSPPRDSWITPDSRNDIQVSCNSSSVSYTQTVIQSVILAMTALGSEVSEPESPQWSR